MNSCTRRLVDLTQDVIPQSFSNLPSSAFVPHECYEGERGGGEQGRHPWPCGPSVTTTIKFISVAGESCHHYHCGLVGRVEGANVCMRSACVGILWTWD